MYGNRQALCRSRGFRAELLRKTILIVVGLAVGMNMLAANVLISPVTEVKRTYLDSCMIRVTGNDTLYLAWLHEVWVYPPMKFKNKKWQKPFWA